MVIVYNCDERYAEVFAVSVLSLFECNKGIDDLTVYLIDNGIKTDSKKRILEIAVKYHRRIIVVPMPDLEALVGMNIAIPEANTRIATCGRLFVTSLLPQDIDKVLYFDCDTIFLRPIEQLWNIDLGDYFAGMNADAMGPAYRSMLGISAEGIYFNSGVVLINMKQWRENDIEKKFMLYLKEQKGFVPWPDQGILNAVLDGKIMCLPCEFNVQSTYYSFPYDILVKVRKPSWFYDKEDYIKAVKTPSMVHFTTTFHIPLRPWIRGCTHPYAKKYLEYRAMTQWKDAPLWEDNRNRIKRFAHTLYAHYARIVPQGLYIATTRFEYTSLSPLMYKLRRLQHMNKMRPKFGGGVHNHKIIFIHREPCSIFYAESEAA